MADEAEAPGLAGLLRRLALTGLAALHNRGELLQVEAEEEKNQVLELFIWVAVVSVLGFLFLAVLTATVILIFPPEGRVYAAGGFALLYLTGTGLGLMNLRALIRHAPPPFAATVEEIKKDKEWLESLK